QRCRRYPEPQRRVVGIGDSSFGFLWRRRRVRVSSFIPTPDALADTGFLWWSQSGAAMHQPGALSEKYQQQESGQNLRPAEAFACKKSTHAGKGSVLPCPRSILAALFWQLYFWKVPLWTSPKKA